VHYPGETILQIAVWIGITTMNKEQEQDREWDRDRDHDRRDRERDCDWRDLGLYMLPRLLQK